MSVTTSDLGEGAVPASDGPGATHYTLLGISLSGGGYPLGYIWARHVPAP